MIEIRPLEPGEVETVDAVLPLHRLDQPGDSTYLVAWDGDEAIGHAHVAWEDTELGVPELQDFFVLRERRNEGIGTRLTDAAERLVAERGHHSCSIGVSVENEGALRLYEGLGYRRAASKRVVDTIKVRGEALEVNDTILFLIKKL